MSAEAISDKIEGLKQGKTEVLESGHTIILGWNDKILPIVDQLCLANASEGGAPILILADRDKTDMEEDIRRHQVNLQGSKIICR